MCLSGRHFIKSITILIFAGLLAACGDDGGGSASGDAGAGGTWIDQVFVDCNEMNSVPRNMMAREVEGAHWPAMCGSQGKTYANEWRCEGERVQIKCR